jgi:probable rRNA maturation factor
MIEIVDNQRKIKLDRQIFQTFAEAAVGKIPKASNKSLTIAFVSDRKMRELNKKFRDKNSTTDVLSFPFLSADLSEPGAVAMSNPPAIAGGTAPRFLGDIVISVEQAERQSKENDLDLEVEIKQLILHGILHLCGYDHETDAGEMNALEYELRDKLGIL